MNIAIKPPFAWTDDVTAKAAEMWNDGISGTRIAKTIGATRNAVISKAHRTPDLFKAKHGAGKGRRSDIDVKPSNGFRSFQRSRKSKEQREAERILRIERMAMPNPDVYDAERLPHAKTLMDLCSKECRWPINEGGPFLYCAAEATDGDRRGEAIYCRCHYIRRLPARPMADMGER